MSDYHPWREISTLGAEVRWADLAGALGLTDGVRIWLDPRMLQAERRATLAHELEHIRRGHGTCQGGREESAVEAAAVRRLIPLDALADALAWSDDPREVADALWVDAGAVLTRVATLTSSERVRLLALLDRCERSA